MSNLQSESLVARVGRIGPGSAFWLGLLFAVVLSIASLIVLSLLWLGLDYFGVVSSVNTAIEDLLNFKINFVHVLWLAAGLAILYLVFIPVMALVTALIYNIAAAITDGLRVRLDADFSDIVDE